LDASGVRYCVVGNTAELPRIPVNDVDLVCLPGDQAPIRAVIDALAARFGGCVAQALQHEANANYHVLRLRPDAGPVYLKIDVCTDYVVEARTLLTAAWLIEGRRKAPGAVFYTCAPEREFAYYLTKKISKGRADDKALSHLSALFAEAQTACRSVLVSTWGGDDAALIEKAVVSRDWRPIEPRVQSLRRKVRAKHTREISLVFAELKRVIGRVFWPTGFVVAVLGPDGSGKSTLLDLLENGLAPLGRSVARFHLKPVKSLASGTPVSDPHAKEPRGAFLSTLKLLYLASQYVTGWWTNVWWLRRRSGIVLFDRYFQDILADPRRYRNGAPASIVRLIGSLVPRPDLFLILDVDPEIARSRKAEVSLAEGRRQRGAYQAIATATPNARLIDANPSAALVALQCEDIIVKNMAERLRRRGDHGW
jgi:thymidylate kinase